MGERKDDNDKIAHNELENLVENIGAASEWDEAHQGLGAVIVEQHDTKDINSCSIQRMRNYMTGDG